MLTTQHFDGILPSSRCFAPLSSLCLTFDPSTCIWLFPSCPANRCSNSDKKNGQIFCPSFQIITLILTIVNAPVPALSKSPIRHDLHCSSKLHNSKVTLSQNYDAGKLIYFHPISNLSCSNEFRPVSVLAPLLKNQPNWDCLQSCITFGLDADFKYISDSDCSIYITVAIARGNRKSALDHSNVLMSNVKKKSARV